MKLVFCPACARLALRGFSFCPHCGYALRPGREPGPDPSPMDSAREPSAGLELMQADFRGRKIDELIGEVETLGAEIDEIVRLHSLDGHPLPR